METTHIPAAADEPGALKTSRLVKELYMKVSSCPLLGLE